MKTKDEILNMDKQELSSYYNSLPVKIHNDNCHNCKDCKDCRIGEIGEKFLTLYRDDKFSNR